MVCHQRQGAVHVRRERGQLSRQSVPQVDEGVTSDTCLIVSPRRTWLPPRVSPSWASCWKLTPRRRYSLSFITKTLCTTFSKPMTPKQRRGTSQKVKPCCDKNNYINVFLSLTGGLSRSGKQLFFNSFSNPEKRFLTVFYIGALCILKWRYFIPCIRCFNYVSIVNITTRMFVASLDGFLLVGWLFRNICS